MSSSESEIRLIVLEILQLLIDRRYYAEKFRKIRIPKDISQLGLSSETKTTRPFDIAFMKKVELFIFKFHKKKNFPFSLVVNFSPNFIIVY
jgi:hypothetical protein